MTETLTAAVALVVLLVAGWAIFSLQRAQRHTPDPHQLWAVARANTSDGVTAHIEVEVVVRCTDAGTDRSTADLTLIDAIEGQVRRRITDHPVASLPSVGDDTPFIPADLLDGFTIHTGVVTVADVEVTPELRRLVTDRSAP